MLRFEKKQLFDWYETMILLGHQKFCDDLNFYIKLPCQILIIATSYDNNILRCFITLRAWYLHSHLAWSMFLRHFLYLITTKIECHKSTMQVWMSQKLRREYNFCHRTPLSMGNRRWIYFRRTCVVNCETLHDFQFHDMNATM
jgi:hypothetical protein